LIWNSKIACLLYSIKIKKTKEKEMASSLLKGGIINAHQRHVPPDTTFKQKKGELVKWKAPIDEVTLEKDEHTLKPTKTWSTKEQHQILQKFYLRPREAVQQWMKKAGVDHKNFTTGHMREITSKTRRSIINHITKMIRQEKLEQIDEQFVRDFHSWLRGNPATPSDRDRTPWLKNMRFNTKRTTGNLGLLLFPDVQLYLDTFVDSRFALERGLAKLKLLAPTDLETSWYYFKFIVRGQVPDPEEDQSFLYRFSYPYYDSKQLVGDDEDPNKNIDMDKEDRKSDTPDIRFMPEVKDWRGHGAEHWMSDTHGRTIPPRANYLLTYKPIDDYEPAVVDIGVQFDVPPVLEADIQGVTDAIVGMRDDLVEILGERKTRKAERSRKKAETLRSTSRQRRPPKARGRERLLMSPDERATRKQQKTETTQTKERAKAYEDKAGRIIQEAERARSGQKEYAETQVYTHKDTARRLETLDTEGRELYNTLRLMHRYPIEELNEEEYKQAQARLQEVRGEYDEIQRDYKKTMDEHLSGLQKDTTEQTELAAKELKRRRQKTKKVLALGRQVPRDKPLQADPTPVELQAIFATSLSQPDGPDESEEGFTFRDDPEIEAAKKTVEEMEKYELDRLTPAYYQKAQEKLHTLSRKPGDEAEPEPDEDALSAAFEAAHPAYVAPKKKPESEEARRERRERVRGKMKAPAQTEPIAVAVEQPKKPDSPRPQRGPTVRPPAPIGLGGPTVRPKKPRRKPDKDTGAGVGEPPSKDTSPDLFVQHHIDALRTERNAIEPLLDTSAAFDMSSPVVVPTDKDLEEGTTSIIKEHIKAVLSPTHKKKQKQLSKEAHSEDERIKKKDAKVRELFVNLREADVEPSRYQEAIKRMEKETNNRMEELSKQLQERTEALVEGQKREEEFKAAHQEQLNQLQQEKKELEQRLERARNVPYKEEMDNIKDALQAANLDLTQADDASEQRKKQLDQLQQEKEELEKKLKDAREEAERTEKIYKNAYDRLEDDHTKTLKELMNEGEKLKKQALKAVNPQAFSRQQAANQELMHRIDMLNAGIGESNQVTKKQEEALQTQHHIIQALEEERNTLTQQHQQLLQAQDASVQQRGELNLQIQELQRETQEQNTALDTQRQQLDAMSKDLLALDSQLDSMQKSGPQDESYDIDEVKRLDEELRETKTRLEHATQRSGQINTLDKKIQELETQSEQAELHIQRLVAESNNLKTEHANEKARLAQQFMDAVKRNTEISARQAHLQQQQTKHAGEMERQQQQHAGQLQRLRHEHEGRLIEEKRGHRTELERNRRTYIQNINEHQQTDQEQRLQQQQQHAAELQRLRQEHEAQLKSLPGQEQLLKKIKEHEEVFKKQQRALKNAKNAKAAVERTYNINRQQLQKATELSNNAQEQLTSQAQEILQLREQIRQATTEQNATRQARIELEQLNKKLNSAVKLYQDKQSEVNEAKQVLEQRKRMLDEQQGALDRNKEAREKLLGEKEQTDKIIAKYQEDRLEHEETLEEKRALKEEIGTKTMFTNDLIDRLEEEQDKRTEAERNLMEQEQQIIDLTAQKEELEEELNALYTKTAEIPYNNGQERRILEQEQQILELRREIETLESSRANKTEAQKLKKKIKPQPASEREQQQTVEQTMKLIEELTAGKTTPELGHYSTSAASTSSAYRPWDTVVDKDVPMTSSPASDQSEQWKQTPALTVSFSQSDNKPDTSDEPMRRVEEIPVRAEEGAGIKHKAELKEQKKREKRLEQVRKEREQEKREKIRARLEQVRQGHRLSVRTKRQRQELDRKITAQLEKERKERII
jgi:hypothetical protein